MGLDNYFQNCHAYLAVQSSIELIPSKQAAVYGFYDLLSFDERAIIDSIDEYVTKNGRHVQLKEDDWPFELKIKFRGNPERFKGEGRRLCKSLTKEHASDISNMLLFLSFLNEPLYIGKTDDLRVRLRAHHDSDFLYTMKNKYDRHPGEFLLFAFFCDSQYARVLESILLQVIRPSFCKQLS